MKSPNLFIVGAMKAGTSSLHEYLHQHPDIFMSRFKEPQYFAPHRVQFGMWGQGQPLPEPGIEWYLRLFQDAKDARYAGESSVSYSARHWVSGCEQRIWEFNPEARIIYLMRDPVERAISHYWHFVAAGRETLSPAAAVRRRDDYIARSDYAYQLEPYLHRFGEDRVFLLTTEELESDGAEACRRLFRWLEIDSDAPVDVSQRFNVTQSTVRQTRRFAHPLHRLLISWHWGRMEMRLPNWLTTAAEHAAYRQVDRKAVAVAPAIDFLRRRLAPTVRRLERLLGRDFPEWSATLGDHRAVDLETQLVAAQPYQSHIDCVW